MKLKVISIVFATIISLACQSCNDHKRKTTLPTPITYENPGDWSLSVEPTSDYDRSALLIEEIVLAFHDKWTPVSIPIRFVGTLGPRYCGTIYTVGCNPEPDLIEFDVNWVVWVIAHDIFHVFAKDLKNPYHNNPHPRDPFHQDPRWDEWNNWRDELRRSLGSN